MPFFLRSKAIPRSLERLRVERGQKLNVRISVIAVFISTLGALLETIFGAPLLAFGDALIPVGALISFSMATSDPQGKGRFAWLPLYIFYWVGAGFTIFATGGIRSPHLVPYLLLLFIAGTFFEVRLRAGYVLYFCLANLFGWSLVSYFGVTHTPPIPHSPLLGLMRNLLFLAGALAIMDQFFKLEETLAVAGDEQETRAKEAQAQLAHAEKMAQVGNLVATTAHEFAQPVQIITMSAAMIKRLMPKAIEGNAQDSASLIQFSETVYDASQRLARLLDQLREFSRKDPFQARRFDCCEALRAIETMTRFDLEGRGLRFVVIRPDTPIEIMGDVMKVQQILFNLIGNARDAALRSAKPWVEVTLDRRGTNWVRFQVRNSGPAMPLLSQRRIFEPYFTTKKVGEGTGLGLAVCADLVSQHQGRIFFSSEEGETVFIVDLPTSGGQPGKASPEPAVVRANS